MVFESLLQQGFEQEVDVLQPARLQFDGQGSYGNGGAMRIAPAALFACRKGYDFEQLAVRLLLIQYKYTICMTCLKT